VRGVSDEQKSRFVPASTPPGLDGKREELLSFGEGFGMLGQARLDVEDRLANCGNALGMQLLIMALGKTRPVCQ